jgi:hypothetical protein
MNWSQHTTPPQSVEAIFGSKPPALSALRLHETRSRPSDAGEQVDLLLEWPELPESVPQKWRVKGHKALQILFTLHATTRVEKSGVFCGTPVSIEINPGFLTVRQDDGSASMTFSMATASVRFHPYGGDSLHEGARFQAFRDDA